MSTTQQLQIRGGKNGNAFKFYLSLVSASSDAFQDNPTLAAGDVKVARYTSSAWSVANITTLPTQIDGTNLPAVLEVSLSATEMTADDNAHPIMVFFRDAAGAEWLDQMCVLPIDDVLAEVSELGTPANLGDGATVSGMLTAMAGKTTGASSFDRSTDSQEAARDDGLTFDRAKNVLYERSVSARHANGKPQRYTVSAGLDAFEVETTIDGNGNTQTESQV